MTPGWITPIIGSKNSDFKNFKASDDAVLHATTIILQSCSMSHFTI